MSARFAIAFVAERGKPVERPHWAVNVRTRRDHIPGTEWQVTPNPEQAQTWANESTAARWAERMTYPDVYEFAAVPAPAGAK